MKTSIRISALTKEGNPIKRWSRSFLNVQEAQKFHEEVLAKQATGRSTIKMVSYQQYTWV